MLSIHPAIQIFVLKAVVYLFIENEDSPFINIVVLAICRFSTRGNERMNSMFISLAKAWRLLFFIHDLKVMAFS